jgi:uncharacterized membrane protein YbhN (UPF0104 family)
MAGSGRLMKALRPFHAILASSAWNWIGFALSATIVAISVYVLTRLLRDIDIARVAADLYAMPTANITAAIFFVACAYGTLTWYDLFALRTIEANHVPYRIAALATFTSYAIGHNIGATALFGGAIRYRIYSRATNAAISTEPTASKFFEAVANPVKRLDHIERIVDSPQLLAQLAEPSGALISAREAAGVLA